MNLSTLEVSTYLNQLVGRTHPVVYRGGRLIAPPGECQRGAEDLDQQERHADNGDNRDEGDKILAVKANHPVENVTDAERSKGRCGGGHGSTQMVGCRRGKRADQGDACAHVAAGKSILSCRAVSIPWAR